MMASIFFTGCLPALFRVSRTFRFVARGLRDDAEPMTKRRLDICLTKPTVAELVVHPPPCKQGLCQIVKMPNYLILSVIYRMSKSCWRESSNHKADVKIGK